MVVIHDLPDGNWRIEADWMIPREVDIEDGAIQQLRDELVRMFGYPPDDRPLTVVPGS